MEPGRVVIQSADNWREYRDPVAALSATETTAVRPLLRRVEEAVSTGLHAVGLLCYEAAGACDAALVTHAPGPLPLAWFGLYRAWQPVAPASALPWPGPSEDLDWSRWRALVDPPDYAAAIDRIKEAIAAGETYQVNYTMRLQGEFSGDPAALAARLWRSQHGGFGAYLELGDQVIISASPELFFELDDQRIVCRPMKGTRGRGRTADEDAALAGELVGSAKDRAENLMIVDMLRNDLGRIAVTGSVEVPRLFEVERYRQVLQMTSTVTARTTADLPDILTALFPCASITGAPKVRTMGLIRDLEPTPRGIYCGTIGTLDPGRQARFNVAIRTVWLDRATGRGEYGVGGGIVWDSTAEAELAECQQKALVLNHALPAFHLLETMLYEPARGFLLLERHLARLGRSAAHFGFACDLPRLRAALEPPPDAGPSRVRLTVGEDGTPLVEWLPFDPAPPVRPWRLAWTRQPVDSREPLLYHKTTARSLYDAARAEHPEANDVLLVNERGEVTESGLANLVVLLDGQLLTPPVTCGLLPGVYREWALAHGLIREQTLTPAEVKRAERLFLINSVRRFVEAELMGD